MKYISKLGANCVRIPLRSELLFKKTAARATRSLTGSTISSPNAAKRGFM